VRRLPEFDDPPVIEVALSAQLEPLAGFRVVHFGLLWERFRDKGFRSVEEHGPLDSVLETFEPATREPAIQVRMFEDSPPPPRVWFVNEVGTELIQVQSDRFVHNWRKGRTTVPYPRYKNIRSRFLDELKMFEQFTAAEELGRFQPTQCEITYINHILAGDGWASHGELENVFTIWQNKFSDDFLRLPEDAGFALRFRIPDSNGAPIGRLHIALQPAFRGSDKKPVLILTLTARGAPAGNGIPGILSFLDLGHDWIVQGFTSITTPQMHRIWRKTDD
jgi:uncharacterized protein (TIGR04255 family)